MKEALVRVESIMGIKLLKRNRPIEVGDHPEEDESKVLNDVDHKKFQMLIGMLNWLVNIGRLDIAFATSSLSRFTA